MTNEEFEKILTDRLSKIEVVLGTKAKEYAHRGDRLHNFKVAARIAGSSKVKAAWGMAAKHLVSVIDLVNGDLENTQANVDEKIGDLINYLILIEALFKEDQAFDEKALDEAVLRELSRPFLQ